MNNNFSIFWHYFYHTSSEFRLSNGNLKTNNELNVILQRDTSFVTSRKVASECMIGLALWAILKYATVSRCIVTGSFAPFLLT